MHRELLALRRRLKRSGEPLKLIAEPIGKLEAGSDRKALPRRVTAANQQPARRLLAGRRFSYGHNFHCDRGAH
jgi:hypothetical protein